MCNKQLPRSCTPSLSLSLPLSLSRSRPTTAAMSNPQGVACKTEKAITCQVPDKSQQGSQTRHGCIMCPRLVREDSQLHVLYTTVYDAHRLITRAYSAAAALRAYSAATGAMDSSFLLFHYSAFSDIRMSMMSLLLREWNVSEYYSAYMLSRGALHARIGSCSQSPSRALT